MALQLILGATGTGKSKYIYNEMIKKDRDKNSFFIVPEQYTQQAQLDFFQTTGANGLLNIELLSFNRLNFRFYDYLNISNIKEIDETGISMMIRKILKDNEQEFNWLRRYAKKQGYIEQLNSVLTECYQYNINIKDLESIIKKVDRQDLKAKLLDIKKLMELYNKSMSGKFINNYEITKALIENMSKIEEIKQADIYIDAFLGFTPIQYSIIEGLLRNCANVYICVTIPKKEKINIIKGEDELYYESKNMISYLKRIAYDNKIVEEKPIFLEENDRFKSEELKFIADNLYEYPIKKYEKENKALTLIEANSIEEEIEATAVNILQLIKKKDFRFNEIVVLVGNLNEYEQKIKDIFAEYKLSCFIDKKDVIDKHPLIRFVLSALKVAIYNFRQEDVFAHIKSLYYENIDAINRLENIVLAKGIRGISSYEKEELKDLVEEVDLKALMEFTKDFNKSKTVEEKTKALYEYLEKIDVNVKHGNSAKKIKDMIELQDIEKHIKVYELVIEMLDMLVEMVGEEEISEKDFFALIETGIKQLKLGQAPVGCDGIIVGDIARSRFNTAKALFILGVNEKSVPSISEGIELISDYERQMLMEMGLKMAPDKHAVLYKERIKIYSAFTKSKELLYVSYSKKMADEITRAANVYLLLKRMFNKTEIIKARKIIDDLRIITKPIPMFKKMARYLSADKYFEYEKSLGHLFAYFMNQKIKGLDTKSIIKGLEYTNSVCNIDEIDNEKNVISISELENYAGCPYSHFLKYRLGLKERDIYEISALDIGNLYHKVLEKYLKKCHEVGIKVQDMEIDERNKLLSECIDEVVAKEQIFIANYRNKYLLVRLTRILRRTIWNLENQFKGIKLTPIKSEYKFDGSIKKEQKALEELAINVENGKYYLKGVIDRLDEFEDETSVYISVVDYKSGNKSIDISLINDGLQLQLPIYLKVATTIFEKEKGNEKEIIPCGLYYYYVNDPMLDKEIFSEDSLKKELVMNGLTINDENIISMLGEIPESINYFPVKFNKNGSIKKSNKVVSKQELDTVMERAYEKAVEIAREIDCGKVKATPYRKDSITACDYCPYKAVCRFDIGNKDEYKVGKKWDFHTQKNNKE